MDTVPVLVNNSKVILLNNYFTIIWLVKIKGGERMTFYKQWFIPNNYFNTNY